MSEASRRSRVHLDAVLVVAAKVFAGASVLAINLFAVRHLSPDVYGVLAFCLTNLQLFDALIGSALDMSVLKLAPAQRAEGSSGVTPVERAAVFLKMSLALTLLTLLVIFGERLGDALFHRPGGRAVLVSFGVAVLALLLFRSVQTHFQLSLRFREFSSADLGQAALRTALMFALIGLGVSSPAILVAAYGMASLAVVLTYGSGLIARQQTGPHSWYSKDECRRMLRQTGTLAAIACFSLAVFNLDMFFLAVRQGPGDVGILRAAYTIAFIPELLGMYVGQAIAPRIIPMCRTGSFPAFYKRFQIGAVAVASLVLAGGLVLIGPLAGHFFPPGYRNALGVIRILLPAGAASLAGYPLTLNFMIFQRPKAFFITDAALAPLMVAGYYFATRSSDVADVAKVTTLARIVKFAVIQILALRLLRSLPSGQEPPLRSHSQMTIPQ
jgi:O-antigen/teichoic acid export membrane protein